MCESHLYNLLDELKTLGLSLKYDKIGQTYRYTRLTELRIEFSVVDLDEDEQQDIEGGVYYMTCQKRKNHRR
jgi:hypothetical protein